MSQTPENLSSFLDRRGHYSGGRTVWWPGLTCAPLSWELIWAMPKGFLQQGGSTGDHGDVTCRLPVSLT